MKLWSRCSRWGRLAFKRLRLPLQLGAKSPLRHLSKWRPGSSYHDKHSQQRDDNIKEQIHWLGPGWESLFLILLTLTVIISRLRAPLLFQDGDKTKWERSALNCVSFVKSNNSPCMRNYEIKHQYPPKNCESIAAGWYSRALQHWLRVCLKRFKEHASQSKQQHHANTEPSVRLEDAHRRLQALQIGYCPRSSKAALF